MARNNALVVVNSVYQLLTAVHLARTLLRGRETDLLLTNVTPALPGLRQRLEETGLFARVVLAKGAELQGRCHLNRPEELDACFQNREALLRGALSGELGEYGAVYFANFDVLARLLACRYDHTACRFFWYEDGFSSYVIDYLRPDRAAANRHPLAGKIAHQVEAALLYQPGLALRGDRIPNLALPKLPQGDGGLLETLDFLFSYQPLRDPADVLFLEQSFRAENIPGNDLELMGRCWEAVGPGRFLVKPHPRNPQNIALERGLTRPWHGDAPWELYLLHGDLAGKTVVTVCSNGALAGRLALDPPSGERVVLLYRLFTGKVLWKEDPVLRRYLDRFCREQGGQGVFAPETVYQLENYLRYVGGEHGKTT